VVCHSREKTQNHTSKGNSIKGKRLIGGKERMGKKPRPKKREKKKNRHIEKKGKDRSSACARKKKKTSREPSRGEEESPHWASIYRVITPKVQAFVKPHHQCENLRRKLRTNSSKLKEKKRKKPVPGGGNKFPVVYASQGNTSSTAKIKGEEGSPSKNR